jgi:hypothetical protein
MIMQTSKSDSVPFDPDTFFRDQVSKRCNLPGIADQDAFSLHHAATDLVSAIGTFERLVPKLGARELTKLAASWAKQTGVSIAVAENFVANIDRLTRAQRIAARRKAPPKSKGKV